MYNEILTAEQRERTHFFNTFFYGQLNKENGDTTSGLRFVFCLGWRDSLVVTVLD